MTVIDVAQLLHSAPGFLRTLGARVVTSSKEQATLRLDAGPELHNHLHGPHAAAIFGLGETTCFALLLEVFGDLTVTGVIPLVKRSEISYSAIATGPLLATAQWIGDEAGTRAHLAARGSASFPVEVVFTRESDGVETARATYQMALKQS